MKNIFCRGLLSLALTGMVYLTSAQNPLKVGDALPKQFWEIPLQMVNTPQKTTTLSADKDKLILLDFWATWCGACLKNFPKMHQLSQKFGDRIKILPLTTQDQSTVLQYFASPNGRKYGTTTSAVAANEMKRYFPHQAIPYIIWIKDGKVLNTTDGDQVTEAAIEELLSGRNSNLQTVIQIDRSRPLMLAEQFDLEKGTSLMNYVLFSKGRIRAIAPGSGFHRQGTVTYGRQFTNVPLLRIYRGIAYELFEAQGQQFSKKRLINLVKNAEKMEFMRTDDDAALDEKAYNFEFVVPVADAEMLYGEMLKAVNTYSGYTGTLEMQRRKCLVLKRSQTGELNQKKKTGADSGAGMRPLASLIADLNDIPITDLPVIDESGYKGEVPVDAAKVEDMNSLKRDFINAGFHLEEAERELLMLVIRDK